MAPKWPLPDAEARGTACYDSERDAPTNERSTPDPPRSAPVPAGPVRCVRAPGRRLRQRDGDRLARTVLGGADRLDQSERRGDGVGRALAIALERGAGCERDPRFLVRAG